jgi:hypothetical protein
MYADDEPRQALEAGARVLTHLGGSVMKITIENSIPGTMPGRARRTFGHPLMVGVIFTASMLGNIAARDVSVP